MQEVTMSSTRIIRTVYYLAALGFHWAFFFTTAGNYFHGGTPLGWITLEAVALLIVVVATKLVRKIGVAERVLVVLCAGAPAISVVWTLIEALRR